MYHNANLCDTKLVLNRKLSLCPYLSETCKLNSRDKEREICEQLCVCETQFPLPELTGDRFPLPVTQHGPC